MGYTPAELKKLSNEELNQIFCESRELELPSGKYRGRFIRRLDNRGAKLYLPRFLEFVGFQLLPFGIDFRTRRWFFFPRWLQAGHFDPEVKASRWRDTEAVTLDYSVSRLPRFGRTFLYDEVKPLSDTVILGLGGINRERGMGDHFFFSLELIPGTEQSPAPREQTKRIDTCD